MASYALDEALDPVAVFRHGTDQEAWSAEVGSNLLIAVESTGGKRITDKRDPPAEDMETISGYRGRRVRVHKLAGNAWRAMVASARAAGIAAPMLELVSGYRSTAVQRKLFASAVKRYGSRSAARKWVAAPGGSAHHSGRAIDVWLGSRTSSRNVGKQRRTAAWRWLRDNAERFGFYPYTTEPWHWEYNPPASSGGRSTGSSSTVGAAIGALSSLSGILASAVSRGSEIASVTAAIANGERNANTLTNKIFFARHPERNGRKIARGDRQAADEWLDIRRRIVRPLLARAGSTSALRANVTSAGNAATSGATAGISPSAIAATLGRIVETRNGQTRWTYQFTQEDLLWTARLIVGEAGGRDNTDNAAVIQALINRFALFTRRVYPTFSAFIRRYSTPLQPVLNSSGAARRHMNSSSFKRTGGFYRRAPNVPKGQLRRHLDLQARPWNSLSSSARALATRALSGGMANPGIGLASEFASTRIFFRSRNGRNPNDQEWRDYTRKLARRKNWQWIGDVPGINQRGNAFFLDNRARGRPVNDVRVVS